MGKRMNTESKAYVLIPLTQGLVTAISPEDFERVSQYTWATGKQSKKYFAVARVGGKTVTLHRFLLGDPKHKEVDHINGFTLDNRRRCNLRLVSRSEQNYNRPAKKGSTSRYKGVSWSKWAKKWKAEVTARGKRYHIGYFNSEEKAAWAYDKYAKKLQGEFAYLNFPGAPRLRPPRIILEQRPHGKHAFARKYKTNTSGFIGVYFHKYSAVWCFQVVTKGKCSTKYGFGTPKEAAIARENYIIRNRLPNRLNFPKGEKK